MLTIKLLITAILFLILSPIVQSSTLQTAVNFELIEEKEDRLPSDYFCKKEFGKSKKWNTHYQKWLEKKYECIEEQANDPSKTCYYEIKFYAYSLKKLKKWDYRLKECKEIWD